MSEKYDFGKEAEEVACGYLQQKGYIIHETRWRSGHKEIDIIAQEGNMLVIVEVKARAAGSLQAPEDAVDERKIRNLVRAADTYIRSHNINLDTRFDIIAINAGPNGYDINHIIDAFWPPINV